MVPVFITLLFILLLNSNIAIQISLSFVQYFKIFRCVDAEIFRGGGGVREIFFVELLSNDISRNRINIGKHEN